MEPLTILEWQNFLLSIIALIGGAALLMLRFIATRLLESFDTFVKEFREDARLQWELLNKHGTRIKVIETLCRLRRSGDNEKGTD